ncbi:DUF2158 domain-containing protein [Rhizobium sp. NLR4a]|uniref:YodC family protein n=1 Tax=Rhizobium sp. NLR4a TaxID=2731117 RepID=UPI001C83A4F2|nr:DUF2158 domain-containing protein [Rhizobium sp. NLR4a]MBX5236290.1 DUF2158 domain-containing protein [Rhizobium sp. NLR4a]
MEFKIGDTVELKSGGPKMTIKARQKDGDWWCVWFNSSGNTYELKSTDFHPETLKKA